MGLWDRIKDQFIDIIEWTDDSRDTVCYKFPTYANEIKMGAKLTVRESQNAVFVNKGQITDVFPPGMYTLSTDNMPILSTLMGWKYGFASPFKVDIFYAVTRDFGDQKWGTQHPILVEDPRYGALRVRAFGTYSFRVVDPAALVRRVAGTDPLFTLDEINGQLRSFVIEAVGTYLTDLKTPINKIRYNAAGEDVRKIANEDLADWGIDISKFAIENIGLPPEVERAMDKGAEMQFVGDMGRYQAYQSAQALEEAAKNPAGGGAGMGVGLGAGVAMGQQMMGAMRPPSAPPPAAAAAAGTACANGHPNAPGVKFCSECGARVGPAACPKCSTPVAAGTKFCSNCGTPAA